MIVVRNVHVLEDGSYEFTWGLTTEQIEYLLTFAINQLLAEGIVSIEDNKIDTPADAQKQRDLAYLDGLDEEDLPQA